MHLALPFVDPHVCVCAFLCGDVLAQHAEHVCVVVGIVKSAKGSETATQGRVDRGRVSMAGTRAGSRGGRGRVPGGPGGDAMAKHRKTSGWGRAVTVSQSVAGWGD